MEENEKHETASTPLDDHAIESSDDTVVESLEVLREKKTDECMLAALVSEDPLLAGMGMLNADLLCYAKELRLVIEPALKSASASADVQEMMLLSPVLDTALRIYRQSERFSTFIDRCKRQQESAEKAMAEKAMAKSPMAAEQIANT